MTQHHNEIHIQYEMPFIDDEILGNRSDCCGELTDAGRPIRGKRCRYCCFHQQRRRRRC